jgi:hypothetical protein
MDISKGNYPSCICEDRKPYCDLQCKTWQKMNHLKPAAYDQVNHPEHYGGSLYTYEAIKVIEAWRLDFCLGNAIKYISRAGKKDPKKEIEDLEKAAWYLNRRIQQLKGVQ